MGTKIMSFYIPKLILWKNVSFIVNVKTNNYYGTYMQVLQEMQNLVAIWELYASIARNV
jgi:hypothetical protein